jgi:putative endonuclease
LNAISIGRLWEDAAVEHLQANNLVILHRNFRCKVGEIDIIARDKNCVIFVEVRYRRNDAFGNAAESVTRAKQQKIIRTARFYLQTRTGAQDIECRFDVVAISPAIDTPRIEWIKDAFNE